MRRPRGYRRKSPEELEKIKKSTEQSKKEDKKNCLKGKHRVHLYPTFCDGKWDGKSVYCRLCKTELTIKELDTFWKKWVKDCAEYYKEALSKLPPIKRFNKDGY